MAIVSIILFLIKAVVVFLYIGNGLFVIPLLINSTIKHEPFITEIGIPLTLSYMLLSALITLVLLLLFSYYFAKKTTYNTYLDTVKIFLVLSIPVFYVATFLVAKIQRNIEVINLLLFKGNDLFNNLCQVFFFHASVACYPVLISSLVFKVLAEKYEIKNYELEQKYIREEKKKQEKIDNTNKEIEYYKKVSELDQLLKRETITQEKYNELKNSLDSQYNKNI